MNSYSSFNTSKGKSSRFVHFVFKNGNTAMLNLRKIQRILDRDLRGRFYECCLFSMGTQNITHINAK